MLLSSLDTKYLGVSLYRADATTRKPVNPVRALALALPVFLVSASHSVRGMVIEKAPIASV